MANKIDSNTTGLRYAEEETLENLPVSPVWYPLDPNSYKDFGSEIKTVSRNPINPTRQRKKGVVTDLDATGGFVQDLTQNNLTRLLQGFFFADIREKVSTIPTNGTAVPCTSVTGSTHKFNFGADPGAFAAGDVIVASGFGVAANNGLFVIDTTDADDITLAAGLADEASPPATAKITCVGKQLASGTSAIEMNGSLVRLTDSDADFTTFGLIAGEWIYLGSDTSGKRFADNNGFARISVIAEGYLEFDKTSWTATAETGTAKTIQIYLGSVLRNENDPDLIVRRSYNLERTLGSDDDGVMSEYLVGAVANELTINIPQADKITVDMSFVAVDNEQRDGATGVKSGTRPILPADDDAFNTSSDFSRIKLAYVSTTDAAPTPLFAFATELNLTIKNNVSPDKAISVLGAFDITAGGFELDGKLTAYFADVAAVAAVRNNSDITIDFILAKNNAGILVDVPLLALGDGRLTVEKDKPIMIPLSLMAAESNFNHTVLFQSFPYLPTAAE